MAMMSPLSWFSALIILLFLFFWTFITFWWLASK